jgi:hypothetical protein
LSETLQSIAEELPSTEITAFDIARVIAGRHPEYASGRLRGMTLDAPVNTVGHEWELWRDSIARLSDRAALARSRHKVIDGRLFLAGLGLIDKPLRDALDKRGDWAPLLLEVTRPSPQRDRSCGRSSKRCSSPTATRVTKQVGRTSSTSRAR